MTQIIHGNRRVLSFVLAMVMLITFTVPASAMGFDDLATVTDLTNGPEEETTSPDDAEISDDDGIEPDNDTVNNLDPSDELPDVADDDVTALKEEPDEIPLGTSDANLMPDGFTFTADSASRLRANNSGTTITMTIDSFIKHRYPFKNGTSMYPAYIFSTSDGRAAYCVEPAKWNSTNSTWMTGSLEFDRLSGAKQTKIAKAIAANTSGTGNHAMYMAAQVIIWEIAAGESHRSGSIYNAVVAANSAQLSSAYESILSAMNSLEGEIPSFMSGDAQNPEIHSMTENGGSWSIDLTNTNSRVALNAADFKSKASLQFSVSGSKLTVTSSTEPDENSLVEWNGSGGGSGLVFWKGSEQAKASDANAGSLPGVGYMAFHAGFIPPPPDEEEPEQKVGYLEITKYDGTNNLPLGGAVFRIECDGFIDTAFSVPYGGAVAVIPIPAGQDSVEVTVTEVTAPYQYAADPTPQTVTVTAGDIVNVARVSFVNYPQECSLTIYKHESGKSGVPLAGARFRIRYADANVSAQVWTLATDASGIIKIDLPAAGTLIIEELEAPNGYVIGHISTWDVVVAKGEHKQIDISNDKKSQLIVYKKDAQSGQFLAGAVIKATLLRSHTPPYEQGMSYTATTDAHGVAVFSNLIPGEYRVEEQSPPQYYLGTDIVHNVSIYDGNTETVRVTFENEPWTGLTIKKVDATDGRGLAGAVFKLYEGTAAETTRFLGDFQSNENGVVVIQNLESNKYYTIVEAQPPHGYFLDENHSTQTILIKPDAIDKNLTVIFRNQPKPKLLITKIDEATGTRLPGAVFRVAKRGSSEYVEVTTGSDGTVLLENMDAAWYQVTEIRSPSGYLLDSTVHDIELIAGEAARLVVNNSKAPSLTIRKVDAQTGEGISGVVLRITKAGAMEYQDVTTGANGVIVLDNMEPGWITIVEQKARDGYLLDQTPHHIQLVAGGNHEVVISNKHKPSLKIVKLDSVTKQPLQYVTFSISYKNGSPIGSFTTDENGEIYLEDIDPGTVIICETKSRDGYIIADKEKEVLIEWGKLTAVEFLNTPKNPLLIKKIDSKTGEPLSGAVFTVTRVNGEFVGEYTTGRNGFITVTGIEPGYYTVREVKSPDGYILNDTPKTVELKLNQPAEITFENKPLNGIQISKIDGETRQPLEGVKFVVREKDGRTIGEFTTNRNGLIDVPDLEPGWYQVYESETLDGYLLDSNVVDVELAWNDHKLLEFSNYKLSGLQIRKLDAVTGEPIQGVKFRLTKISGELVGEYTTNAGGFIAVSDLEPGWYSAYEIATIPGYILDATPQNIQIKKNSLAVLEFTNRPLTGLQIRKSDAVTGEPLAGVEFKITELSGAQIGSFATDSTGVVFIPNLKEGWYVVSEIKGLPGYKPDTAPRNVELKADRLNILEYKNYPYPVLQLKKIDADLGQPLEGVRFRLLDKYQREIGIFTTNSLGQIMLSGMDEGKYFLQEVEAKPGYVLDSTVREISLQWGKTTAIEIKNTPMASLRIKKVDAVSGKPVPGTTFLLYDMKNNVLGEYVTDDSGVIELPRELAAGKYKLKESGAAPGYVLDDQMRTIELKSGATTEIVIENAPIRGKITIVKKSADDNLITREKADTVLAGAVFEVYDKDLNVVDTITTDSRGIATTIDLPLGIYGIKETKAPDYYFTDGKVFYGEVKLHGDVVRFEVLNNSQDISVTVEKRGNVEVVAGDEMRFDFSSIANTSNVSLDEFYWQDQLPTDAVRLKTIFTGTWSESLTYKVVYKTNLKSGWRTLADNLTSKQNHTLDCTPSALKLAANEHITDVRFEFGTVSAGFHETDAPSFVVNTLATLTDGYRIINKTDVGGKTGDKLVVAKDTWITVVLGKPRGDLPKTGF